MRALGLAVDVPSTKRPAVRAVLLQDSLSAGEVPTLADIRVEDTFQVPSGPEDLATQLKELTNAVAGRVRSLKPDLVVVRRADPPPRPSNHDGPRFRLMTEGAITAAARDIIDKTTIRTGRECGAAYGVLKRDLEADAKTLVPSSLVQACAAALAGLLADRA